MKSATAKPRARSTSRRGGNLALTALVPLGMALAPLSMMVWVIAQTLPA